MRGDGVEGRSAVMEREVILEAGGAPCGEDVREEGNGLWEGGNTVRRGRERRIQGV